MRLRGLLIYLAVTLSACATAPEFPYPAEAISFLESDGISLTVENKLAEVGEVEQAYKAWQNNAPNHYSYVIAQSCYCLYGPAYGPNEIEVKAGEVVRVTYRGETRDGFRSGDSLEGENAILNESIDGIFERLIKSIDTPHSIGGVKRPYPPSRYSIEYESTYGFPVKTAYEDKSRSHGEWVLIVQDFKLIE